VQGDGENEDVGVRGEVSAATGTAAGAKYRVTCAVSAAVFDDAM
jgi:hypothetical protein